MQHSRLSRTKLLAAISQAQARVNREIGSYAEQGFFAAGLASEGYNGGYRDALSDVMLLLNGVTPDRNQWWEDKKPRTTKL